MEYNHVMEMGDNSTQLRYQDLLKFIRELFRPDSNCDFVRLGNH